MEARKFKLFIEPAALAGPHKSTSFRWRYRFLRNTKSVRRLPLGGITDGDET